MKVKSRPASDASAANLPEKAATIAAWFFGGHGAMSDANRTFTGGCHCGLVRFECTSDLAMVTSCNCSICTKKGLHFTFLPPRSFQLRAGGDNLREYLFNKHAIRHQLCADCGVDVFARGQKTDGTEIVALNVSCIDGIDLAKVTMTPIDGRSR